MLVGVEAGGIVGFMGRSVLGQYEIALLDPTRPPRLLLVAPNLRLAAEAFEADEAELLEWVIFHELTHAVQFTGVPWLRDHLAGMLRELLASIKVQVDPGALLRMPSLPSTDDLQGHVGRGARRRPGRRHGGPRAQGRHRPPPGDDGDDRGPRRARDGRRRRPGAALAAEAARLAGEAPPREAARWSSSSRSCSGWTSR